MTKPSSIEKSETASVKTTNKLSLTKANWHKPYVQKLRVSLDTASFPGSGGDGVGRSSIPV